MTEITNCDREFAAELDRMPRMFAALPYSEGKVLIDGGWRLNIMGDDPVCRCGAESLKKFLSAYCGINLPIVEQESIRSREIRLSWTGQAGEGYSINIESDFVDVHGNSPAGALYGAHRLQWMLGDNGGPYLDPGSFNIEPGAKNRITSTPFHQGFDDAGDPLTYTDGYLDLMAHYGFNVLHMYIDIYDYIEQMPEAPDLINPKASERIARLADLSKRASCYNIEIYLHVNALRQPEDHPVFKSHPELKGATSWETGSCCLCSSEPMVAQIYAQTLNNVIDKVPGVKGIIAIIGGECLLHCYTRPFPRTQNGTNCKRCGDQKPEEVVANLINSFAENVWQSHPDVDFVVWPYSAHLWSTSPDQRELIPLLDKRISFMTCYEKDAWIEVDGAKTSIFDYSISYVGPSDKYKIQRDLSASNGNSFYVKTESSIAIEMLNVPYVPAMENWQKRWQGLLCDSPRGVLANWRFIGLTGTLSEEIAYRETWKSGPAEDVLAHIAQRLAGDGGRLDCLAAWHIFSEAFSQLAFCPGLSGFPYFRGPMYLGTAHPLILHSEEGANLPKTFFEVDPVAIELDNDADSTLFSSRPVYFDDYRWTLPLGIARMHTNLERVCNLWDKGLESYQASLKNAPSELRPVLQGEIDVALMADTVLRSTLNLARFQMERDRVLVGPFLDEEAEDSYQRLMKIVEDDLDNSRAGMELAKKNFRFGYGFTYGRAFDANMIQAKIDFTQQILIPDIERFYEILVTHAFARPFIAHKEEK